MRTLIASLCISAAAFAQSPGPTTVGAIRWDAWHGRQGLAGRSVERALAPAQWHYRLPFYATIRGDEDITIDATEAGTMDKEIAAAQRAGLSYWAFVTYGENDEMSRGLKQYLASPHRGEINFCLITEGARWKDPEFSQRVVRLITTEKGYQTVAGTRPLLYLGFLEDHIIADHFGNIAGFRRVIDSFRDSVIAAGGQRPYIVIMDFDPARGSFRRQQLDADAISAYATPGDGAAAPYAELARHTEQFWSRCKDTGEQVVPIAMSGWDRRPRVARPMPWETWQKPGVGIDRFYHAPTPAELADHIASAVRWTKTNTPSAQPQTVIIYAWNENDEGGWLIPTLKEGAARLEALAAVLNRPTTQPSTPGKE